MGMTPKEIIGIVRRHVLMIIIFTFLGTVAGGAGWFLMRMFKPKYRAMAAIEVTQPVDIGPFVIGGPQANKDLFDRFRNTKAAYMQQQSFREKLLAKEKIQETKWYGQFDHSIADAVEDIEKHLGVSTPRDSELIYVSMTCGNAKESADIANEAVKLFLWRQVEIAKGGSSDKLEKYNDQRVKMKRELDTLERNLASLREATPQFSDLRETTFRGYLDDALARSIENRNELEARLAQTQVTMNRFKERLKGDFSDIIRQQIERDSIALSIRQRITSVEQALAQQKSRLGERHRNIRELKEALDQLNTDLDKRKLMIGDITRQGQYLQLEDQIFALTAELKIYTERLQRTQKEHRDLSLLKANYARVVELRDEKQKTLETVNMHIEKLNALHNDPKLSKVRQAFVAPVPLAMSSPNITVYVPGGFMLGMLAGLGLAFLIELLNDLLRTPSDVIKHLRVPLLGAICHSDEDDDVKGVDLYQVIRQAPYSMMSEGYRQLRTNLRLSETGSSKRVLFVTSPGVSCGKTSVAVNLASTLVAEGQNILLLDTHFRKPATTTIFPRTAIDGTVIDHIDVGLSNYLMGQCDYHDVVRPSGVEGLSIIDSGPLPSNPTEILGNANMTSLLENAGHEYDYVIIDGPPLIVTAAKVLAAQAEGTILVFNTSSTRRGEAQRTLRELREIKANVVGTVLIGVRAMKGGYFHERYRTYKKYQNIQIPAAV
jgi:capsular exopolysaccharide synthesis family protein